MDIVDYLDKFGFDFTAASEYGRAILLYEKGRLSILPDYRAIIKLAKEYEKEFVLDYGMVNQTWINIKKFKAIRYDRAHLPNFQFKNKKTKE
jgi:hypothetical protein